MTPAAAWEILLAKIVPLFLALIETMPFSLQILSLFHPLRHYIAIIRGILLKGVGLEVLWLHVLAWVTFSCRIDDD